jgi:hypothetical protein
MTSDDDAAGQPMDAVDFEILDGIRGLFELIDPMPADLPERVRFSLAMRGLESELARLVSEDSPQLAGARGTERSRTITFDSASLSIMIRIEENKDGSVRVDGWLAPGQPRDIEMRTATETLSVSSDADGRFAFAEVPSGTARLVVVGSGAPAPCRGGAAGGAPAPRDQSAGGPSVVTPALVL